MDSKILVAYATTHGSTQEISEAIAVVLREQGLAVDARPARDVRNLDGYSAVVLGAPLYMFHWHKDARRFLSKHHQALMLRPVAIFAGGPIGEGDEKEWQDVRRNLDQELANFPWLAPAAVEIVGGKFDPDKLRFPYNLIPAMKGMPAKDLRDWAAIHAWAEGLVTLLQPVTNS
jgi:menaquinone-dependent protoporphyrinogen oxidase